MLASMLVFSTVAIGMLVFTCFAILFDDEIGNSMAEGAQDPAPAVQPTSTPARETERKAA